MVKLLLSAEMRVEPYGPGISLMRVCFSRYSSEAHDCWQAKVLQPNPPPKVHQKLITWTEHRPTGHELITSSADGTVKVWKHPET